MEWNLRPVTSYSVYDNEHVREDVTAWLVQAFPQVVRSALSQMAHRLQILDAKQNSMSWCGIFVSYHKIFNKKMAKYGLAMNHMDSR